MQIQVGSKNPTKIQAVKEMFPNIDVNGVQAESGVSEQPFSDEETRLGAITRAKHCAIKNPYTIGIGLEGGVMYMDNDLYLCNWGALVTPENDIITASGARIKIPKDIEEGLLKNVELGTLMDTYAERKDVSKKEGAIGIFTNQLITRQEMFRHVVTLLKGQWMLLNNYNK
ncbi:MULTISPECIES: DUF84 family protein [Oceanobacillus]|uniref:inosine/xanthosine triphosphatase n=1 Tax=Oceanobacillus kimchii TaxID=746691 RepID=A0ABQ5TL81_9BACI|nr:MULTISPECIES: DUF84 family protein [Oceanobacillus]MBT2600764.1 DUF84 family protein [Oceanobacillus sp. ISL-74]MBT2650839.1 DUF84 family protein [Oceanobacillus sp. ISL-73]MCT1575519.1 DUF84 family protein [Oceanobacillus kimchii]MCT2137150.1 DUF84 family protein [Oceanobacillus kimchii]OEH55335.1 NTPase [Oceanobacillus sp. E9]